MITRQDMIDKIEDYLNTRLQDKRNATGRNLQRFTKKHHTYKLHYNTLQMLCESADDYLNVHGDNTGINQTHRTWQEWKEYSQDLIQRIAEQREKIAKMKKRSV